jgi:hypothetical protein
MASSLVILVGNTSIVNNKFSGAKLVAGSGSKTLQSVPKLPKIK